MILGYGTGSLKMWRESKMVYLIKIEHDCKGESSFATYPIGAKRTQQKLYVSVDKDIEIMELYSFAEKYAIVNGMERPVVLDVCFWNEVKALEKVV